jgi:NAD(P)-dependent dehydrogenase (short-subunit alcohol dehydrogenase family)
MLLDFYASHQNTTLVRGDFFLQIADVGDYAAIARVIDEALTWRPIDVLICNAGITRSGFFEDVSVEDLNAVVQTNLLGTVYPVHAALPSLKERSRSHPVAIVFIGSLASLVSSHDSSKAIFPLSSHDSSKAIFPLSSHDSSKAIFPLGSCDHRFCAHTRFPLCFFK